MGNKCVVPQYARLMLPDGKIKKINLPAQVAEMMIEEPGFLIGRAKETVKTRRVSGMCADEKLEAGEVYLLLSVDKVGSRVSDRQLEVVIAAIGGKTNKRKKVTRRSQVTPVVAGDDEGEKNKDEKLTGLAGVCVGRRQQWRPKLDTICE